MILNRYGPCNPQIMKYTLQCFGEQSYWFFFVIFELGPDSESLCNALPSELISCGIMAFFHPKNGPEVLGTKKEKSHHDASTLVWEKNHFGALNCTKMTFLQNKVEAPL